MTTLASDDPRHGKYTTYNNWGCRCDACTDAWARRQTAYMQTHPEQRERHKVRARALYARQRKTP